MVGERVALPVLQPAARIRRNHCMSPRPAYGDPPAIQQTRRGKAVPTTVTTAPRHAPLAAHRCSVLRYARGGAIFLVASPVRSLGGALRTFVVAPVEKRELIFLRSEGRRPVTDLGRLCFLTPVQRVHPTRPTQTVHLSLSLPEVPVLG